MRKGMESDPYNFTVKIGISMDDLACWEKGCDQ